MTGARFLARRGGKLRAARPDWGGRAPRALDISAEEPEARKGGDQNPAPRRAMRAAARAPGRPAAQ